MKARVKATGEIVEINESSTIYDARLCQVYNASELENIPVTDPDYWTRLEHQYAGMALSRLVELVNHGYEYVYEEVAILATNYAIALVEKLKSKNNGKQEDKEKQAESRHPFGDTSSGHETNEFDHIG